MDSMQELFGEVIFSYTRKQALEDGVLVDVSETSTEAGFVYPVALTSALCEKLQPCAKDAARGQDYAGRLWDLLYMLHMAIKGAIPAKTYNTGAGQTTLYKFILVQNGRRTYQEVKAICGPGDEGEPVITAMLPEED